MLDNLYENVGSKIKKWAKWIFIIEAISTIVIGLFFLFADENLILYGFITLICGPIVALMGSWILYAFGEIVEKTCDNEKNTKDILRKLPEPPTSVFSKTPSNTYVNVSTNTSANVHKWRCDGCGNMRTQIPCEFCGKE